MVLSTISLVDKSHAARMCPHDTRQRNNLETAHDGTALAAFTHLLLSTRPRV